MSPPWTADRFDELFRTTAPRVRRFVTRHVEPDDVDDVLAETFTVAWRRLQHVPEPALPWLLVVARNMCRRHWRGRRSADRWLAAVSDQWREVGPGPEGEVLRREEALLGFASCTDVEREALLLTAWDGLDHREAARVAGCSTRAFTVRLSRARARFDRAVDAPVPDPPTARTIRPTTVEEPS